MSAWDTSDFIQLSKVKYVIQDSQVFFFSSASPVFVPKMIFFILNAKWNVNIPSSSENIQWDAWT